MKRVALSEVKDDIGFRSEDDWFGYRLENDPRFLRRIEAARRSLRAGLGVPLEELEEAKPQSELRRRAQAVSAIHKLRKRLHAKYGEMPDSTDLLRQDRDSR